MPENYDEDMRRTTYDDDDLVPFDVQDYSSKRSMRVLIGVLLIAFLFIIAMFRLYYKGTRDRTDMPRISADNTPYKVEPENPGGENVPNQDKSVYDVMNGTAKPDETVTVEPMEEPMALPKSVPVNIKSVTPDKPPAATVKTVKPAATTSAANGDYVVQVASVRSAAAADDIWYKLENNSADVLPEGAYPDIKRVNLEEKGVYFRLRIAGLDGKDTASRLCERLETRKQACFVTRK